MRIPQNHHPYCKRSPELQCGSRKTIISTASFLQIGSADLAKPSFALQAGAGGAVQKPESRQEHCKLEPGVHCRSRKACRSNASRGRGCSTKVRKPAGALQAGAGSTVQKPESRQEQCKLSPNLQCGSRKSIIRTASALQSCIADLAKPSSAMQALSRLALQIPQIHHQQCIHPSPIPREHPRRTTPGKSAGMNRLTTFFSIPLVPLT